MASKGPDKNVEPNDGVRSQLMKKDFIIIQNFPNHLVQGKPQSCSEKTFVNHYFVIFQLCSGFFSGKMNNSSK
jgi:hypothetical protein